MKIVRFDYLPEYANTYVIGEEGGPCLIVDLGDEGFSRLAAYCHRHHSKICAALLTHGHYDHIAGLRDFPDNIPIFIHNDEKGLLFGRNNLSAMFMGESFIPNEDLYYYFFEDGDEMVMPPFSFKIIHTPFHTQGSSCFYFESGDRRVLFSGDTLFRLGIGRTDLPGGRENLVAPSLRKLTSLHPETIVYPGHGASTKIGDEIRMNPYFAGLK